MIASAVVVVRAFVQAHVWSSLLVAYVAGQLTAVLVLYVLVPEDRPRDPLEPDGRGAWRQTVSRWPVGGAPGAQSRRASRRDSDTPPDAA